MVRLPHAARAASGRHRPRRSAATHRRRVHHNPPSGRRHRARRRVHGEPGNSGRASVPRRRRPLATHRRLEHRPGRDRGPGGAAQRLCGTHRRALSADRVQFGRDHRSGIRSLGTPPWRHRQPSACAPEHHIGEHRGALRRQLRRGRRRRARAPVQRRGIDAPRAHRVVQPAHRRPTAERRSGCHRRC
jgi:hypothetical protein